MFLLVNMDAHSVKALKLQQMSEYKQVYNLRKDVLKR